MSKLKRYYQAGYPYFITCVTDERKPILVGWEQLLIDTLNEFSAKIGYELIAYSILPNHLHAIINPGDNDLSSIMARTKLSFSKKLRYRLGKTSGPVWQKRFWDHMIRNERDFKAHLDYIHYNPVKHGLVLKPGDWEFSSYGRFLEEGMYSEDWGVRESLVFEGSFGE